MKKYLLFFLFLFANLSPSTAGARPSLKERINPFINSLEKDKTQLQGGAVAILYKGEVLYKTTFGYKKGTRGPITSKTLFPLASVSKPVCAIALALLVEKGKLNLEENLKGLPLKQTVSFKHLLSHTTGYKFPGNALIEQGIKREKLLETLKTLTPECKPGDCYLYSNALFSLINEGLILHHLSLEEAIHNLKSVLNISDLHLLLPPHVSEVVYPHIKDQATMRLKVLPLPPYYPKIAPASAGVFASLDSMIEFFKLSFGYKNELISNKILKEFYKPIAANDDLIRWGLKWPLNKDIDSFYGLGWRHLKLKKQPERSLIFHSGYLAGMNSFIGFIPSEEIGIIILLNQDSKYAVEKGFSFWRIFLN